MNVQSESLDDPGGETSKHTSSPMILEMEALIHYQMANIRDPGVEKMIYYRIESYKIFQRLL
jgi:hypothetical protein